MAPMNFEEALKRLEEIVRDLELGDRPLEKSLELFEEGMEMSRICTEKLTEARHKIDKLVRSQDGSISVAAFEDKNIDE